MGASIVFPSAFARDSSDRAVSSDSPTKAGVRDYGAYGAVILRGHSPLEWCHELVRTEVDQFIHFGRWHVAHLSGVAVSAINCCSLPKQMDQDYLANSP